MYLAICTSTPNSTALRDAVKPEHDAYWSTRMDKIRFAGPMLSDDGSTRFGQILVIDAEDRQIASAIVLNDPFVLKGVFCDVSIRRFRVSVDKCVAS